MEAMLQYIGVKLVQACKMTVGDAQDNCGVVIKHEGPRDTEGYLVEYSGGYQSWCPKQQFEDANRLCDAMTFGHAMEIMKQGGRIRLPKWAPDVFISIQTPDEHSKMTAPYFYFTSRFGMVPWIPTMIEMFSEEWAISEE